MTAEPTAIEGTREEFVRDVRAVVGNQSGRPGYSRTQVPHRSGRAQLTHPALRLTGSLQGGRSSDSGAAVAEGIA